MDKEVQIRDFKWDDAGPIDDIFNRQSQFGVPSLYNSIQCSTLLQENKVVGYGTIKLFAEGILLLDPDIEHREKALAVRTALRNMLLYAKDAGLERLYVVSSMPSFTEILRNKCGFEAVPGELLMLDLTEEK